MEWLRVGAIIIGEREHDWTWERVRKWEVVIVGEILIPAYRIEPKVGEIQSGTIDFVWVIIKIPESLSR